MLRQCRRVPGPADAYLICSTPRTGSTLLCGLLRSTGIAGTPESYFRAPDVHGYAKRWGIAVEPDGSIPYRDFFRAAVVAGSTANGVFGARVMWGTMDDIVENLRGRDADDAASDLAVLEQALGRTRFVHLRRDDQLAQAVSWARAEQTGHWQDRDSVIPGRAPRFDHAMIESYLDLIRQHTASWQEWFEAQGVTALSVPYEELVADVTAVTGSILQWLDLDPDVGHPPVPATRRQADDLNAEWIERYRATIDP